MFSCFSRYLNKNDALTLPSLIEALEGSYTNDNASPKCIQLEEVFDARAWLQPHMEQLSHHSGPHHFKIDRNTAGKAVMTYKV